MWVFDLQSVVLARRRAPEGWMASGGVKIGCTHTFVQEVVRLWLNGAEAGLDVEGGVLLMWCAIYFIPLVPSPDAARVCAMSRIWGSLASQQVAPAVRGGTGTRQVAVGDCCGTSTLPPCRRPDCYLRECTSFFSLEALQQQHLAAGPHDRSPCCTSEETGRQVAKTGTVCASHLLPSESTNCSIKIAFPTGYLAIRSASRDEYVDHVLLYSTPVTETKRMA